MKDSRQNKPDKDNTISELKEINEELENYFQSTIIPQFFFDKDLILRKFSPAAMKHFSVNESDIGKTLDELKSNLRYDYLKEDIEETMSSRQAAEKEVRTNTDKRWYRLNILPFVKRKTNETNGVIITFVDIHSYVLSLGELQRLNSEYETFVYSVSHDLKAPVNNIEGLIEAFKEEQGWENSESPIFGMLNQSVQNLKQIIKELAESNQTSKEIPEFIFKNRLWVLVDEIKLMLHEVIARTHTYIETDFDIPELTFDRKNLRSILYNLISNSIKYRSEDRKLEIKIATRKEGEFVLLSVRDNGRGIEEDKVESIFSKFTRLHTGIGIEGTGIGLYLVCKIVNANGGKIKVNSKVGEGTEFLVFLKEG